MYSWELACIDAYKILSNYDGWLKCKSCNEYPRLWIFDNGQYARCRCNYKYDNADVRTESIMSYYRRTGKTDNPLAEISLKEAWNNYVTTGKRKPLPLGHW